MYRATGKANKSDEVSGGKNNLFALYKHPRAGQTCEGHNEIRYFAIKFHRNLEPLSTGSTYKRNAAQQRAVLCGCSVTNAGGSSRSSRRPRAPGHPHAQQLPKHPILGPVSI